MAGWESIAVDDVSWKRVFDQAAAGMAVLDLQGNHLHVNEALCQMLGYSEEELRGLHYVDTTHPDDFDGEGGLKPVSVVEKRFVRSDGSMVRALLSRSIIRDENGSPCYVLSQFQDVTARREAEMLWERSFAYAPIGMALLDRKGNWTVVNDTLCELLGYTRDELLTMTFNDITIAEDRDVGPGELVELFDGRRESLNMEKRYRHRDGHQMWILIRSTAVPGADGTPAYVVSQYEEAGEHRMVDAHLAYLALHDPLTGLANRTLLADRLDHALRQLGRGHGVLAVIAADLDRLKPVNDHYGHAWGDRLLIAAANELLAAVDSGDTVARIGGDEFVVVSLVADEEAAETLHAHIVQRLDTGGAVPDCPFELRASIGLVTTDDPDIRREALLDAADRAMYKAKKTKYLGSSDEE